MTDAPLFVAIDGNNLEYTMLPTPSGAPVLVFLHEGLGSVSLWRDFPARLAARARCGALVYSRLGHGQSDPEREPRPAGFFAREAATLRHLLDTLQLHDIVLVGHSDGGSIALAYLAGGGGARGAIVAAPHVIDEDVTWRAIERQRALWPGSAMRTRMARHHRDPDATFAAWSGHWLAPEFRGWSLVPLLAGITRPLLAVQGQDDIYGTMRQIDEIAAHASGPVALHKLAGCGHDPFRDQPETMLALAAPFTARLG